MSFIQPIPCESAATFEHIEDTPHVSGDVGAFVLAVRNDAGTPLADDGDYIPFTTDETGALRVNASFTGTFTGTVTVALDCTTDSVTICPGDDPIDVIGTVDLGPGTLAALETITVLQGTSPWIIDAAGGSLTVDAVDLDIRNLTFATDKIDVSFSVIALDAATLAALETVTVLQGTSPWAVDGTVELGATTLAALETITALQGTLPWITSLNAATLTALESITVQNGAGAAAVNIQDGGNSITIDDGGLSITIDGTVSVAQPVGTMANGAETPVAGVAVQILAANASRQKYFIQNTGPANIRVGVSGVTATTGVRLVPNGNLLFEMPHCPTQAIFAVREGAISSVAFAQEIT